MFEGLKGSFGYRFKMKSTILAGKEILTGPSCSVKKNYKYIFFLPHTRKKRAKNLIRIKKLWHIPFCETFIRLNVLLKKLYHSY